MGCLGNILWFLFCGFWQGLAWAVAGVLWSITIVGLPIARQCFKFSAFMFFPFGKEIHYGGGALSAVANVLWIIFSGVPLSLAALGNGLLLCCTIIGIPFGLQCFKFAKLAFMPFGAHVQ